MIINLNRLNSRFVGLVLATVIGAGSSTAMAAASTQFNVSGAVTTPSTYDYSSLSALPSTTQIDSFGSGSGAQTHDFQGTSLWGVLNTSGIATNPAVKNDVLNKYVLATGSDGYKVVYSLGELNPNFGNKAALVAYAENKGTGYQPLTTTDGFARTTAPGDVKGGRYVSNLVNLNVASSASTTASLGGGVSTSFSVSGDVINAQSFNLDALKSLTPTTYTVGTNTYTGVSFWDLLNTTVGLKTDASVKNDLLGMYVVATGTDGYKAVFSLGELSSSFGNQPDFIAYQQNGVDLTTNGFARIVVGNDVKAGRWVSNLASLEVFHATVPVPEPETYAMLLAGLVIFSVSRVRRSV